MTNQGTVTGVISYIKMLTGDKETFHLQDLRILPARFRQNERETLLFVLYYRGIKIDVYSHEIPNLKHLSGWKIFDSWKHLIRTLHFGDWSLHSENQEKPYLSFLGKRCGSQTYLVHPFSVFDVLPTDIMNMVRENKWRIALENPDKVSHGKLNEMGASVYVNRECASLLMNMPLACYSVKSGERVKTLHIDVRDLQRVMFPRYQCTSSPVPDRNISEKFEPCFLAQDLFDAMLMHGKLWFVDRQRDIIYLPCLPKPPKQSSAHLMELSLPDKVNQTRHLHSIISHMSDTSINNLLNRVFPHSNLNDKKSKIAELLKRVKGSGPKEIFKHGTLFKACERLVCMLPELAMFL